MSAHKALRDAVHELEEMAWDTAIAIRKAGDYATATKWLRIASALNDVGAAIDQITPPDEPTAGDGAGEATPE